MKKKSCVVLCVIVFLFLLFVACDFRHLVTMPYSSKEYKNAGWTLDELILHFEELGFNEINVEKTSDQYGEEKIVICSVEIEDSDSFWGGTRPIEKGEKTSTYLEIRIEYVLYHPTITKENSTEFAQLVDMNDEVYDKPILVQEFMEKHDGEFLEFQGIVLDAYDKFWYASDINFIISIGNSVHMQHNFKCSTLDLERLGYCSHSSYFSGLLSKGDILHCVCRISATEDSWSLALVRLER